MADFLLWAPGAIALGALAVWIVFAASPWPAALLYRWLFEKQEASRSRALEKHLPPGISACLDEHYDPDDKDAWLDVFFPERIANTDQSLLPIVWVHGGAWISGNKELTGNYARILAGKGHAVVCVGHSLAPGKKHPVPVRQVNAALEYLKKNARRLHLNASRFVLAGDSSGSQIAAQLANALSVPSYARMIGIVPSIERSQLGGVILFGGTYDVSQIRFTGRVGSFLRTIFWSYSGVSDFTRDPGFAAASVMLHLTPDFPPMFISAGNGDPFERQSRAFAEAATAMGVFVDALFFSRDYAPPVPHVYQFDLDSDAGRLALEKVGAFTLSLERQGLMTTARGEPSQNDPAA